MLLALVKFGDALVEPNTRNYDFAKLNGRIGENVHIIVVQKKYWNNYEKWLNKIINIISSIYS